MGDFRAWIMIKAAAGHIGARASTEGLLMRCRIRLFTNPPRGPVQPSADWGTIGAWDLKETAMTTYTVGLKLGTRTTARTIDAEDALVAALKSKLENPEALITYVRKSNQRGDRRHPHRVLQKKMA